MCPSPAAALPLLAALACADAPGGAAGSWRGEISTRGDTTIVRTAGGSVWGGDPHLVEDLRIGVFEGDERYVFASIAGITVGPSGAIYVLEHRPPLLRMYDADGRFVRVMAQAGGGPGEIRQPQAVEALSDGRVIVWDQGNQRLNVYSAAGDHLGEWPLQSALFAVRPMSVDSADRIYVRTLAGVPARDRPQQVARVRVSSAGEVIDTLLEPAWPETAGQRGFLEPSGQVDVHPGGYFVAGWGAEYTFELRRARPLRVEKAWSPVRLGAAEREDWERWIREVWLPSVGPGGADTRMTVATTKPAYRALHAARDGRVWVHVYTEGIEWEPAPGSRDRRFRDSGVFDLFDGDGRFLARVAMPDRSTAWVRDREFVWGVQRGEHDEPYIVRWRIGREEAP